MNRRRTSLLLAALLASTVLPIGWAPATLAAPVGQGFNLNRSDLRFILKQIKIAERHAATATPANPCETLFGPDADQIPEGAVGSTLSLGLRTVDGSCNNIALSSQNEFGTADNPFPRLVAKKFRDAEDRPPEFGSPGPTTYASTSALESVVDSRPRIASNLIVDQTAGNPAAVAAAGAAPPTEGDTLVIPNTAPDVGLSAPYNSWFTMFGQFFDHGLDLVNKGGRNAVFVPLKADDPLYVPGARTNFMVLTRASHNGDHEANNQTSSFVDQSQTYTSHPSHQVFLREYLSNSDTATVTTGRLLSAPTGGMATWADVKNQAATLLGIRLVDADATKIPLLRTDPYGRFVRGPNGYPLLVTGLGLDNLPNSADDAVVEGNPAAPVAVPANALRIGHPFLADIAHHAVPGLFDPDGRAGPQPAAPQTPDSDPGTGDDGDPATYDDEMLGAHFIAGDGRVNENIGLIAVHHIFHSEHNRLTGDIQDVITTQDAAMLPEWQLADGTWNGERLFQAARFVTEMEYQHLAFEEFARKVQPMVNAFGEAGTGYHSDINPAIRAEFAHAVYRFGHSMLTETVARVKADGTRDDKPLLDVFLNPPAFMAGYASPEAAAGSIVRGMTRQVGNEIDEFVTEALRNNLLGLPLDLATLNIARARETGTPSLNEARRAFYAASADTALTPYQSWADMSFSLRHAESLPNFIGAYGTHPSVTAATTVAAKRAAGQALLAGPPGVDGQVSDDPDTIGVDESADNGPEDSYDFLNSIGAWANTASGVTTTGVDDVDLWVGGLAEKQMVFGGLLGSTFNYVFEKQMEDLQDADRFYYLARTAGLNLLTQLEGNSLAELIHRNTDAEGLPADAFSRPDYIFSVGALGTSGPIPDDPATEEQDESALLTRMGDGTIRYGGPAHVVFNGTPGDDKVHSSEGDDTIRGNVGNDRMEGGDGNDNLIGGEGHDILTDLAGDETLKGGDGNDALSSGKGFGGDLNQGGRGKDFIVGGNDMTETLAGPGDDFVFAGAAEDVVFGDDGDDWIEGGTGPFNLLQGDNGAPFQDDPNEPGNDVMFSYGGEQDYDAEGGNDVMLMGPGIQRAEGAFGFDWTSHKSDPAPADADMRFTAFLPLAVENDRDRWDLVESMSGWNFDDVLRGDDRVASTMVGHGLDAAGIAGVNGLAALLPAGASGFTGGNILLGGAGSDLIEGRGGDDLIDGDAWYDVQLQAPDPVNGGVRLVDSMAPLQADVFAGRINPGDIHIVRTIRTALPGTANDTVVFSGPRADYDITFDGPTVTVRHARGSLANGTDTVRNVELLNFIDQTVSVVLTPPGQPTGVTATGGNREATVGWTAPASDGGSAITSYEVNVRTGTTLVRTVTGIAPTASSTVVTGLTNGTPYTFTVAAVNGVGTGAASAPSNEVTPLGPATAPTGVNAVAGDSQATVSWAAPSSDGGSPITSYQIVVRTGNTNVRTVTGLPPSSLSAVVTELNNGTAYTFRVRAVTAFGNGNLSAASAAVTPTGPATAPAAPVIGRARQGNQGGPVTATANWTPGFDGGSPITAYRVTALRMNANGTVAAFTPFDGVAASARSFEMTLAAGNYRFTVAAVNAIGTSPESARSNQVAAR